MDIDDNRLPVEASARVVPVIAGALGLVLIGFGIWALAGAIFAAWELFKNPDSIGYFARYFMETTKIAAHLETGGEGLSHLASWLAVVLLLLVLGKLGSWSIGAGAALFGVARRR